jgi:hypothetical protein
MVVGEGGGDEMSILTITIIAIIVNFVLGIIAGWISKDGRVAIGAAIIADMILFTLYVFL